MAKGSHPFLDDVALLITARMDKIKLLKAERRQLEEELNALVQVGQMKASKDGC